MATVGDLVVNLGLNRKGYSQGLKRSRGELGGFLSSMKSSLRSVALPAIGILGGAVGTAAAISAAREQITAEQKLASVIKSTGGAAGLSAREIADYAAELQKATNFGDQATIGAAAVLGTFTQIKGDTFKEALATAQDMSALLGTDLQGQIIQLGKALNDPIRGMTALADVGVSFSDEQRKQIKHLQTQGDLVGAQKVILDELAVEFGGAAAGVADPLTQAKNLLGDIGEIIGFVILPPLNALLSLFSQAASPIADARETAEGLGAALAVIVTDVLTPIAAGFEEVANFVILAADAIAFGFRNASELSQIAIIDLSLALFDLIPASESVMQSVAGTILGVWDGATAAFDAFFDSVVGGLKEIANVALAVFDAVPTFQDVLAGDVSISSVKDKFIQTFAAQTDAAGGSNPLTAFRDAFNETRSNVAIGFADQGLGDGLRQQREALETQIGKNELEFRTGLEFDLPTVEKPSPDVEDNRAGAFDFKPNKALETQSAEGVAAAIRATSGGKSPSDITNGHLASLNELQADQLTETQRLKQTIEDATVVKVGEIA